MQQIPQKVEGISTIGMYQPAHRHSPMAMSRINMQLNERTRRESSESYTSSTSFEMKQTLHVIPTYIAFTVIFVLCVLYAGIYLLNSWAPSSYKISEETDYPNEFIAERAQLILKGLTDIGPRIVGSNENEVLAVEYLSNEINKIIKDAHKNFTISVDKQVASGAYYLNYSGGLINSYANVQNIVVKIDGRNTDESILINAHFDSVPSSPGASDDGIMVAVMLETLRKLTQKEHTFERNIIFLFNGAEETFLRASHAFITQHKWSKSCKTIINLGATGYGGRAILFQSGPHGSSALMAHYASVPFPFASSIGEEIIQSGILPSDTDYRVFAEFGNLSGFDIAFVNNGYRYHTKYDSFNNLPRGSYQHAGSNLLALVKSLANDPEHMEEDKNKVVYFDFFNLLLISYSALIAYIINMIVAIISLMVAFFSMKNMQLGLNKSSMLYLLYATLTIFGSWVLAAGFALIIAILIDLTNSTMAWYGHPFIIMGLYVAPILGCFTISSWILNYFGPNQGKSLGIQSQIQMHITRIIWSFILFIGTILKMRSVYCVMLLVLFNTLSSSFILIYKWQRTVRKWQVCTFICTIFPTIITMYMSTVVYALLIPITARLGSQTNPELFISMLSVLILLLIATQYVPFLALVSLQYIIPIFFFLVFLASFIVTVTNCAFPYNGNDQSPTPQRFNVYHTNRIHHDAEGKISENYGIYIPNNDRNSPNSVKGKIGLNDSYDLSEDCKKYPVCGLPVSNARNIQFLHLNSWKPFDKAIINETTSLNYSTKNLSSTVKQYSFNIEGPDHLTVFIEPMNGAKVLRTSLVSFESDEIFFITHIYGKTKTNLEFTVDVQATNIDIPLMTIVASGKYFNFKKETKTVAFDDFIAKFPDWAAVAPALATYQSYVV